MKTRIYYQDRLTGSAYEDGDPITFIGSTWTNATTPEGREEIFRAYNRVNEGDEVTDACGSPVRSMSVGDVIRDENDVFWSVAGCGFVKVEVSMKARLSATV